MIRDKTPQASKVHCRLILNLIFQKCRKIFDPADHEQPSRKRNKTSSSAANSPTPPNLSINGGQGQHHMSMEDPSASPPQLALRVGNPNNSNEQVCSHCNMSKNKMGKKEQLVHCRDCAIMGKYTCALIQARIFQRIISIKVHPTCLEYSEELSRKILSAVYWQCINCKTCCLCEEADPLEDVSEAAMSNMQIIL